MHIRWAQYITVKILARHRDRFAICDALSDFVELQPCREVCDENDEPKDQEQTEPRENSSEEPRPLLVSNLHSDVTEQELHAVFLPFGPIYTVQVCRDRRTNHSHGYAFVTFQCRHDAENALAILNFSELMGKLMFIMWGQDMTINVLTKHSENSSNDRHDSSSDRQEIAWAESTEQSQGRRLANTIKSYFIKVMSSPNTLLGIGLLALACTGSFIRSL